MVDADDANQILAGFLKGHFARCQKFLESDKELIILDVGALYGIFSLSTISKFPQAKIYAFEPLKLSYEQLKENLKSYTKIIPVNKALSDQTGKQKIYKTKAPDSSSLLHSKNKYYAEQTERKKLKVSLSMIGSRKNK